jgi:plastocyanin
MGSSARNQTFTVVVVQALVVMERMTFVPGIVNVAQGTTVYWMNLDSTIGCCDPGYHNVVFGDVANASSPVLKRLGTWNFTFEAPGQFHYICSIHPWMVGEVNVTATESARVQSTQTTSIGHPGGSGGYTVTVSMVKGSGSNPSIGGYSPDPVTVVVGFNSTVTWVNDDTAPHTVTANDAGFDSGNVGPGESFTFTFTAPGTYQYYCAYHPWMTGTVVVKAG